MDFIGVFMGGIIEGETLSYLLCVPGERSSHLKTEL